MVPKFANPHSLSQDVEKTTRSEIAERAGSASITYDEFLKRELDGLLQHTWADALAEASSLSLGARSPRNLADNHEGGLLAFRLLSSMKHPQHISLHPKPPPAPVSREPDCEDDEVQAETRKKRALSVAVEFDRLGDAAVSIKQIDRKPVTIGVKIPITDTPTDGHLHPLLVIELTGARKPVQRGNTRRPECSVASPHEPQLSCSVLPVISVPSQRKLPDKKRRKAVKERPLPAYWRPSSDLRGKCMGYALGYPSSWAADRRYVRDTMKTGARSTSTCHAVHNNAKSDLT